MTPLAVFFLRCFKEELCRGVEYNRGREQKLFPSFENPG